MDFEWDPDKAASNLVKHGVAFTAAATVFGDPQAIPFAVPDHSDDEDRFLTYGCTTAGLLFIVSRDDRTRIISARRAARKERKIYEQG